MSTLQLKKQGTKMLTNLAEAEMRIGKGQTWELNADYSSLPPNDLQAPRALSALSELLFSEG